MACKVSSYHCSVIIGGRVRPVESLRAISRPVNLSFALRKPFPMVTQGLYVCTELLVSLRFLGHLLPALASVDSSLHALISPFNFLLVETSLTEPEALRLGEALGPWDPPASASRTRITGHCSLYTWVVGIPAQALRLA